MVVLALGAHAQVAAPGHQLYQRALVATTSGRRALKLDQASWMSSTSSGWRSTLQVDRYLQRSLHRGGATLATAEATSAAPGGDA